MDPITEYAEAITSGQIKACRKLRLVVTRLAYEVEHGRGRWHYDQRKADKVIKFVSTFCRHSKGSLAGQRVELMLWQRAFLAALFGFVDDNGERRHGEALLWCSRKNGKSFIAAAVALYLLVADVENVPGGADVACAATTAKQARIVFDAACDMRDQDKSLSRKIERRQYELRVPSTRSRMTYVSKASFTSDGMNLHGVILDELHAITDRNQYEVLRQAMSAKGNRSPLLLAVSTAGTTRAAVADDIYDYATGVAEGKFGDERYLAWMYEIDEREQYLDPECFVLANPGIGVIKDAEALEELVNRSKDKPLDVPGILTKDFNWRTSVGDTAWLQYDEYHNETRFDLADYRGKWCLGGCDLSRCGDLTSAAILLYDEGRFLIWSMSWLPEAVLEEHVKSDRVPYDIWLRQGYLRTCPGSTIDTTCVTDWFNEVTDKYGLNVHSVWYDAWSAAPWVAEMQGWGYDMRPVRQGTKSLSLPMEHMGALFREQKICYDASPLFEWAVSNTNVYADANGMIKPDKRTQKGTNKARRIDPLAAALNAFVGFYDGDTHDEFVNL